MKDTFDVKILSLANTGAGVAEIEDDEYRRAIFVPFSCPEDICTIKITSSSKKYYSAEIVKIKRESPYRVSPRCRHYTECGGCNLLHIDYDAQLKLKQEFVRFMMKGLYEGEIKVISSVCSDFYRQKIRVNCGNRKVGFMKHRSNEIVDIKECRLIDKGFIKEFDKLRGRAGEYVMIRARESGPIITIKAGSEEADKAVCSYNLRGKDIRFSPSCFIQSNLKTNDQLVGLICDTAAAQKPKKILELFSGIGNISSGLQDVAELECVEGSRKASQFAAINAKKAKNINMDVYTFLDSCDDKYNLVVVDPPRTGLRDGYCEKISKICDSLIMVSCDPSALKRDCSRLAKEGFKVKALHLVDMFPHTNHVECVALFSREQD